MLGIKTFANEREAFDYIAAQKARRQAFKDRIAALQTVPVLKRPDVKEVAKLTDLSDAALAFAAQNPDHSDAGRDAARAALEARLGRDKAATLVDHVIDQAPPESYLTPADIAKNDGVFWGLGRWLRRVMGWAATLSAIVYVGGVFLLPGVLEHELKAAVAAGLVSQAEYVEAVRAPGLEEKPPPGETSAPTTSAKLQKLAARPGVSAYTPAFSAIDYASAEAAGYAIALFPLWSILIGWRQKPARILLLRRFNDKSIGESVTKFSRRWLTPYGHVYSLADKVMKRNWLGVLFSWFSFNPLLLFWRLANIPFAFFRRLTNRAVAGPIMIWSGTDYRNFAARLIDRWGLNLEMQRTQRRAILVRTSDAWWRQVVLMLMHGADAIVVDVTDVASGTVWELQTMLAERVSERVVFVAREDKIEDARADLRAHGFADRAADIFAYRQNGALLESKGFRAGMRAAIAARLAAVNSA
jgi:hypothetical protein